MADPIWLQELKRLLGQSISSERITPERPNFTGTAGVAKYDPRPGYANYGGALVDPHLAAAAGGPGWGSGMAPSTMTKVPASGAGGGFKRVLKHLAAMESPGPDWSLQAQNVGVRSPWSPTSQPWAAVGENMYGSEQERKKKRYA